ncbi:KilA-N domain-containing protein [Moellerella wisconsensis]|uniref:KilA-N domain-containing protein n=1 Tax=Moellerella wisconsensis TaxID=158849 RepID=UPI0025B0ADD9|nr:KilA-N domain-containing protein [Moellerella wisconsensis]WJW81972.1 KilA-N domain-containing protein [Moellerella wisconsensis]
MARTINRTISVNNIGISISSINDQDYISLTDMAKGFEDSDQLIKNWLQNKNTLEFLTVWEEINNPNFNLVELHQIKNQIGLNRFIMSAKKWIESTNAIGLIAKAGRYGGTYAHKDIAFEFGSWLSPEFKLYLIKEFQYLKEQEANKGAIEWQIKRELAKVNYRLQTDAVQAHLLENKPKSQHGFVYASEADLINTVVFGKTNQDWKKQNQGIKGNQRDHGSALDNAIIANLEFQNSLMIEQGASQAERVTVLKNLERTLRTSMGNSPAMQRLEQQSNSPLLNDKEDK